MQYLITALNTSTKRLRTPLACFGVLLVCLTTFPFVAAQEIPEETPQDEQTTDAPEMLLTVETSSAPTCYGLTATIYVSDGTIVGGPDDGAAYDGELRGTSGGDVMVGTEGADEIDADDGDDTICGLGGDDVIDGGDGDDYVDGGPGADEIDGSDGDDILDGGEGNDTMDGGNEDDIMCGGAGSDDIEGDNGNDQLHGGEDADVLDASTGEDICRQGENLSNCEDTSTPVVLCGDVIEDADGDGIEDGSDNCPETANADQTDTDTDAAGDACDLDDDGDGVADDTDNCPLVANAGQEDADEDGEGDACDEDDGIPRCNGLAATVYVRDGMIVGGPDDEEEYEGELQGTSDDDVIVGTDGVDEIDADDGDDTICALGGNDVVDGGHGNDTIFGGEGNDTLDGGSESDILCGDAGDDAIDANQGNDKLDGGDGTDVLDAYLGEDICNDGEDLTSCEDTTTYIVECGTTDDDEDGIADHIDNCPGTANPEQTDTDSDGAGDACDLDDDGDGVADDADNCPLIENAGQEDEDGDGYGDVCDQDTDGDGYDDPQDNCPLVANPEQTDTDADAAGDTCDEDDDGDGVTDAGDNCPLAANPGQEDDNSDGIGNACEPEEPEEPEEPAPAVQPVTGGGGGGGGSRSRSMFSALSFIERFYNDGVGKPMGQEDTLAPGGFGGGAPTYDIPLFSQSRRRVEPGTPVSGREKRIVCSLLKIAHTDDDRVAQIIRDKLAVSMLASMLGRAFEDIDAVLRDPEYCDAIEGSVLKSENDGKNEPQEVSLADRAPTMLHLDENGVPYLPGDDLTTHVWNNCVRHVPTTRPDGRVYHCARYREQSTIWKGEKWLHPTLGVPLFGWNYRIARLYLPDLLGNMVVVRDKDSFVFGGPDK